MCAGNRAISEPRALSQEFDVEQIADSMSGTGPIQTMRRLLSNYGVFDGNILATKVDEVIHKHTGMQVGVPVLVISSLACSRFSLAFQKDCAGPKPLVAVDEGIVPQP